MDAITLRRWRGLNYHDPAEKHQEDNMDIVVQSILVLVFLVGMVALLGAHLVPHKRERWRTGLRIAAAILCLLTITIALLSSGSMVTWIVASFFGYEWWSLRPRQSPNG